MNMNTWINETIEAKTKKALPVISFPAIQLMDISVRELIASADKQAEAMKLVAEKCPTAASVSFMDLSVEAEAFGSTICVSDEEVPTVIGSIIDEDSDVGDLKVPEVGSGRTSLYIEAIKKVTPLITDRPVLAGAIGPFSLAGRLMDVNEIMPLCYEEPELVSAVLGKASEFIEAYIQAFKEAGADGVVIAEPMAGLLSPDLMGEFSTPYVRKIVDAVQDENFMVTYHNCGASVVKAFQQVIDTHAKAFHFGNAINLIDILPLMPSDALVMGNIDPAGQIRNGNPEGIRKKTREVLEACSPYPNFIISTGCDVPPLSPWENIEAFFNAVDEFYSEK